MPEQWLVEGPRVIDVGSDSERVDKVVVAIVGGAVDVVTHADPSGARVDVSEVEGHPVRVTWDGRTLRITHGKTTDGNPLDALRGLIGMTDGQRAVVSVSVPATTRATLSTVSAPIVASGLRRGVTANTVSGEMTISDVQGRSVLNTVSGTTECADLVGDLKVNAVSGAVTVQGSDIPSASVNTVSGEILLDVVNSQLDVQSNSVSGDVTIRAPFSGYAVTASSATGQVIVDGQALLSARRGGMPWQHWASGCGGAQSRRTDSPWTDSPWTDSPWTERPGAGAPGAGAPGAGAPGAGGRAATSGRPTWRSGDESLRLRANSLSGDVVLLRASTDARPTSDRASGPDESPTDASDGTHA